MVWQDFERFKQEIKEWLDSPPPEGYDRFVAEVNDKSAIGQNATVTLPINGGFRIMQQMLIPLNRW